VGRRRELAALEAFLAPPPALAPAPTLASAAAPLLVSAAERPPLLLAGEPGIGKSRLLRHAADQHRPGARPRLDGAGRRLPAA